MLFGGMRKSVEVAVFGVDFAPLRCECDYVFPWILARATPRRIFLIPWYGGVGGYRHARMRVRFVAERVAVAVAAAAVDGAWGLKKGPKAGGGGFGEAGRWLFAVDADGPC